jgi:hypothetical protein
MAGHTCCECKITQPCQEITDAEQSRIYSRDGPRPQVPERETKAESVEPSATQSVAQTDEQTSSDLPEDSLLGLHIPQADREPAEAEGVKDVADVSMEDGEQLISLESAEGTPTAEKGDGEMAGEGSKERGETELADGTEVTEKPEEAGGIAETEGTEVTEAAEEEAGTDEADVRMA